MFLIIIPIIHFSYRNRAHSLTRREQTRNVVIINFILYFSRPSDTRGRCASPVGDWGESVVCLFWMIIDIGDRLNNFEEVGFFSKVGSFFKELERESQDWTHTAEEGADDGAVTHRCGCSFTTAFSPNLDIDQQYIIKCHLCYNETVWLAMIALKRTQTQKSLEFKLPILLDYLFWVIVSLTAFIWGLTTNRTHYLTEDPILIF